MRACLNENLSKRRIGRAGGGDGVLLKWPPRSPDLTLSNFFLWGYEKGLVYVLPLPANLVELKQKITSALETVTEDMLLRAWDELNHHLDVCHVAGGAHIKNLRKFFKLAHLLCSRQSANKNFK